MRFQPVKQRGLTPLQGLPRRSSRLFGIWLFPFQKPAVWLLAVGYWVLGIGGDGEESKNQVVLQV